MATGPRDIFAEIIIHFVRRITFPSLFLNSSLSTVIKFLWFIVPSLFAPYACSFESLTIVPVTYGSKLSRAYFSRGCCCPRRSTGRKLYRVIMAAVFCESLEIKNDRWKCIVDARFRRQSEE